MLAADMSGYSGELFAELPGVADAPPIPFESCIVICLEFSLEIPFTTDPPVLVAEDPTLGDATDVPDTSLDATWIVDVVTGGMGTGDADGTDWPVIEHWFTEFEGDGTPILGFCGVGLDGSVIVAMPETVSEGDPVMTVTTVVEDDVAEDTVVEPVMPVDAAGDDPETVAVVALASSTNSASFTAAPAAGSGTSAAARLFAAYAAGLGQPGAEGLFATSLGGRRAARRAN